MKLSLHFLIWLMAAAATVCSWVACVLEMGSGIAFLTMVLTMGCGVWALVAFSPAPPPG